MTTSGAEYSAPIFDALGKHAAAETLRAAGELQDADAYAEEADQIAELKAALAQRDELTEALTAVAEAAEELLIGYDAGMTDTAALGKRVRALRKALTAYRKLMGASK